MAVDEKKATQERKALLLKAIQHASLKEKLLPIVRQASGSEACLSFSQQQLWLLDQIGAGTAYNLPMAARLRGELNADALEYAFAEIVRRHEILRTRFESVDGRGVQRIDPPDVFILERLDLCALSEFERSAHVRSLLQEQVDEPFDLARGKLFRAKLLKLTECSHALLVTMHHIISDGWSMQILLRELGILYRAYVQGAVSPLPELIVQYADYAFWQRQWLQGERLEELIHYWKDHLGGAPQTIELPSDRVRPPEPSYRGRLYEFEVEEELSVKLKQWAQGEGATLFMVLLAAFNVLLWKWSGQKDIVVGTPIAGRTHWQTHELIGFFVNTLALRTVVQAEVSFIEHLRAVKEAALGGYAHQELPFEKVVQELQPQRDLSRQPLVQVLFALQNTQQEALELPGVLLEGISGQWGTAKFDLSLIIQESIKGLGAGFEYATDLFDEGTIQRLSRHYVYLLEQIVEHPNMKLHEFSLMRAAEREWLLLQGNQTAASYARHQCIHELFAEQVRRTPHAVAVRYESEQLTYQELNVQANQVANYLIKHGVLSDDRVGLCLERSLEMVVGLLGVLKAGAAYVPLDPAYPGERLAYLVADAAPRVILTHSKMRQLFPAEANLVCLDDDQFLIQSCSMSTPDARALGMHSNQLAYVIYTSGSTGLPKGVMIEHANVVRLFAATKEQFEFSEKDVWTLFHSFAFDFSVWELWGALLHGGQLVLVSQETAHAPERLYELLCRERVTVLNQTPSAFLQLAQAEERAYRENSEFLRHSLRLVIFGGEVLQPRTLKSWVDRNGVLQPKLVNMYGITETTVHVTCKQLSEEDIGSEGASVIGRPISDLKLYILDEYRQPIPIGIAGEIYVGGAGVARGYLNRPELTAERFIYDPFSSDARARLYRSGDLARWRVDGNIEYLGRRDDQVKIRGFRIELGEIESRLSAHPQVREAVVIVLEKAAGDRRLAAYVTTRGEPRPSSESLRSYLKATLPEYMVPSMYILLDRFALTVNGKVNRQMLPEPDVVSQMADRYVAPATESEDQVLRVWSETLGLEHVGIYDNFFEVGGDSLLAMRVVGKLRDLGKNVSVRTLFESPTVHHLAQAIDSSRIEPTLPVTHGQELSWENNLAQGVLPGCAATDMELEEGAI